jgi:hypothetical protein
MFEVERLVKVAKNFEDNNNLPSEPTTSTDSVQKTPGFNTSPVLQAQYCDLIADMIVLAFSTGTCRVGSWPNELRFITEHISDWHGEVAHIGSIGVSKAQEFAVAYNRGTFEHIMVKLAAKLDAVQAADGQTLLDHSLLMLTNEHGQITHQSGPQYPVVTAGGAGGYFNTGKFVDFGDQTQKAHSYQSLLAEKPGLIPEYAGLYYHQFLANALLSMGVPASEWETFTEWTADGPSKSEKTKGYGYHKVSPGWAKKYEQAKLVMSDKLPVITT